MGWSEWPLMVFTVLAQSAVGAFWLCTLAILFKVGGESAAVRIEKAMIVVLVFIGVGFLFSSMHLGQPFRAINAFSKIGSAPLSNEGFIGVLFLMCAGLAWLFAVFNAAPAVRKAFLLMGLLLSAALIWAMTMLYQMPTVPTWNNWTTPASFIVTAMVGGAALANVVFKLVGLDATIAPALNRWTVIVALVGFVAAAFVTVNVALMLPHAQSSIQTAVELSPDMGTLQIWRFILLGLGVGIVLCQQVSKGKTASFAALGLLGIVGAEFIGRGLFYGLHMTVGLV